MVVGGLPPLHKCTGISFIFQNTDNCGSRPLRFFLVSKAAAGMGKPPAFLIGQRGEYAGLVQAFRDFSGAVAVYLLAEDILHHFGGKTVHNQLIVVFL